MTFGRVVGVAALALAVTFVPVAALAGGGKPTPHRKPPGGIKPDQLPVIDVPATAARLVGGDLDAAVAAAAALGAESGAAHDALADALATGLAPKVAIAAVTALAQVPAPSDVALLVIYAGHRDDEVRAAAVTALGAYGGDAAARKAV